MKKNLLTLMLSVACIFLLTSSLVAETKISNRNSTRALNSLNVIKTNIPSNGNELTAKYEKLKQLCEASGSYSCGEALAHVAWAGGATYDNCDTAGWGSDTCAEWVNWYFDTINWAVIVCLD